jgi:integrase
MAGIQDPVGVSLDLLNEFRQAALTLGLSNATTEKTITDVSTIVKHSGANPLDFGKRLRLPRKKPRPPAVETIDAVFKAAESKRLQRWLALTVWTGLRISDSVGLYRLLREPCDVLYWTAHKTGIDHMWPVPHWLKSWMPQVEPLLTYSTEWFGRLIRDELAETCERAGVPILTPKHIRQASITAWTQANAVAGRIVHGCGLGVMDSYVDPLRVLQSAASRVVVPACFGASESASTEDALLSHFRRLDPAAQGLIAGTAERLAAG